MGAFLVAQTVKNLPAMWETWIRFWVRKIPWKREWQPSSVFLPGKAHEIWPSHLCCDLLALTARTTWVMHACVCAKLLQPCLTLFDPMDYIACQALLSMGFSWQEYWGGLLCPSLGDLPDPGIEPTSPAAPARQVDSLLLSHQGRPSEPRWILNYCNLITFSDFLLSSFLVDSCPFILH